LIKGAPREDPRKGREKGRERDFFKPTRLTVQPTWGELLGFMCHLPYSLMTHSYVSLGNASYVRALTHAL